LFLQYHELHINHICKSAKSAGILVTTLVLLLCSWHEHTNSSQSRFLCVIHKDWLLSSFDFLTWNSR